MAEGSSRGRAFLIASATALVEPLGGFLGVSAVTLFQMLLPWALTFAAGAMIYVVVEELIPESQLDKKTDVATFGAMMGFAVMMMLDVGLG
jgi:ZIP family zinc transporter